MKLCEMTKEELVAFKNEVKKEYEAFKSRGLSLDMSRGKPAANQLDTAMGLLDAVNSTSCLSDGNGVDCRNYGGLDGIGEAKKLFSQMIGVSEKEVIVAGNSSLNLMYDTIMKNMFFGVNEEATPWGKQGNLKWLCPCPGYDRHFAITEGFGIEMINIPMNSDGPDMDMIEKLVSEDASIKGIWCVPMYSNPTGITFSDEVVKRFASLQPKASDFRIFWDNAYCVHHLSDDRDYLLPILEEAKKHGNEDMIYIFGSTSKVSFAGAGVAVMGASEKNIAYYKKLMNIQTIGYDKINMLRHVRFFKDFEGLEAQMKTLAELINPKFETVLDALEKELSPLGIGSWHKPKGGYFISFMAPKGCAKRIAQLCKEGGVVLTGAGATYPYGKDPDDKNLRIAPTYPPVEELKLAAELFCISTKLAAVEKLLEE
ncbi:MAG: aminotransferase [Ruminococcus sp.]|nr:aminotransferase [Ruminococcus sp.]